MRRATTCDVALPEVPRRRERTPEARPRRASWSTSSCRSDAPLRAEVVDAEYLGTTQIVTLNTDDRHSREGAFQPDAFTCSPASTQACRFTPGLLSLFDRASGRALPHRAARVRLRMAELVLSGVTKRFGATVAVADLGLARRRW